MAGTLQAIVNYKNFDTVMTCNYFSIYLFLQVIPTLSP